MWSDTSYLETKQFVCGYCRCRVASKDGYRNSNLFNWTIYICPNCDRPTLFAELNSQYPGPMIGNDVEYVPEGLKDLYLEARLCYSVSCFTASVLICRKMLMNIAVQQGAREGLKFIEYVDYLSSQGFIPPHGKSWIDHIRKKGNEATHEIIPMTGDNAGELITFIEMLLKFIYEFPERVNCK